MSNEYIDWLKDLQDSPLGSKDHNHWLCIIFPWLLPHNRFTDKIPSNYDYSYTELDGMPEGWKVAFGENLCFEIKNLLEKTNFEYDYRILQIKEKFGELCWYDNGVPIEIEEEFRAVLNKYISLSRKTCVKCGAPATRISTGWVNPYCDKCGEGQHTIELPFNYNKEFDDIIYKYHKGCN